MLVEQLYNDDFVVSYMQSEKGTEKIACLKRINEGISLVLFYSDKCPKCPSMFKTFSAISEEIKQGCKYYVINVTSRENEGLIEKFSVCKNSIEYVPDIVAYIGKNPRAKFIPVDDNKQYANLKSFILNISASLRKSSDSSSSGAMSCMKNVECKDGVCKIRPCNVDALMQKTITEKYTSKDMCAPYNLACTKNRCYLNMGNRGTDGNTAAHSGVYGDTSYTLITPDAMADLARRSKNNNQVPSPFQ